MATSAIAAQRHLLALRDEFLTRAATKSLRAFIEPAWHVLEPGTPFQPNWHIDLIAEYLEAVTAGEITRLVITLPPRYMKSLLVSVLWPTWEWIHAPTTRWVFASHAESLAAKLAVDRRTLLRSRWYQERWGHVVRLASGQNEKLEFHNEQRGIMLATSVGSSLIGKGGNRIVVDDPHHPQQLDSAAQREGTREYVSGIVSTRLDDKRHGAIVVVMQRLHMRDVAALCIDLGYEHLCLPALADARTTIVFPRTQREVIREVGEPLWPSREDAAGLARQRATLGEHAFVAQYQQQPTPRGGLLFKREWWQYYDAPPAAFDEIWQSWDLSFKDQANSDFVVGLVAGRVGANYYLLDQFKGRASFTATCQAIRRMVDRYPATQKVLIEDAANGPAVLDALKATVSGIVGVTPEGGKWARAESVSPIIEAGQVHLPNPVSDTGRRLADHAWVDDFVDTLSAFPNGAHDDDVDALSQLLAQWRKATHEDGFLQYARQVNAEAEAQRMRGV